VSLREKFFGITSREGAEITGNTEGIRGLRGLFLEKEKPLFAILRALCSSVFRRVILCEKFFGNISLLPTDILQLYQLIYLPQHKVLKLRVQLVEQGAHPLHFFFLGTVEHTSLAGQEPVLIN